MINDENNNHREREFSLLAAFIIWCSCADKEVLKTCSNSVIMKYMALGCLILVPSVFALPSASFFIKTAFFPTNPNGIYPAITFGLLWSWVVLCFDRYLVISFHKGGILKAFGRVLIGGLISFVLAEPLVLQMFNYNLTRSIAQKTHLQKEALIKQYDDKIAVTESEMGQLKKKATESESVNLLIEQSPKARDLHDRIAQKQAEIRQAQSEYSDEVAGASNSRTGKHGIGPVALSIQEKINSLNSELNLLSEDLNQVKAEEQNVLSLKKQMLLKNAKNVDQVRKMDLQMIQDKTVNIAELKQDKIKEVEELKKYAVVDFLTLSEELDILAATHKNVRLQKWLFTALLFFIDMFAVALKWFSDNDDELIHKQTTVHFSSKLKEEAKQQALLETIRERMALQIREEVLLLDRQELAQLSNHYLLKMKAFSMFIQGYSGEVNKFQDGFLHSPHYRDELLKEYMAIADRVFDEVLAKMREEAVQSVF